jgi:hypothetical protein
MRQEFMRFRLGGLASVMSIVAFMAGGCEDGAAQQREDVQHAVAAASAKLHRAVLVAIDPSPEEFESARTGLEAASRELASITGGDPGQQAARAMLSATASREIGSLNLRRAAELESQLQSQRNVIRAQARAMSALHAVSFGYASISTSADREMLGRELQTAQQRLEELSARMAELDGPIAERTGANTVASKEVETLKLEVGELRRKAQELGYARGLALQEQAIEARRRADRIEYDIAQREMELGYDLKAEHDLAGAQAGFAQNRIGTIETSQAELDEFMRTTAANISSMRNITDELAGQITGGVKQVDEAMASELVPLYEQAQTALEKSASQAQQAAGQGKGDDVGAARLLRARALELQGRLAWNRARGLADHLAMLQAIKSDENGAPGLTGLASQVQATQAAYVQAIEQATNAYSEAQQALEQVSVKQDQAALDRLKSEVSNSMAILTGKPIETKLATPSPANEVASGDPSQGFASADALLAHLKSLAAQESNLITLTEQISDLTIANTEDGKKGVTLSRQLGGTMQNFAEALEMSLGKPAAAGMLQAMPLSAGIAAMATASISEQTDDRAKVTYSLPGGVTKDSWLVNVNGSWFIDGDAIDAAEQAQLAIAPHVIAVFRKLTDQLRNGEIASPEALKQELMSAMSNLSPPGGS